jgi:peptidoglycan/xylan/chitin deacetylase (PgdA/CDA1 family)
MARVQYVNDFTNLTGAFLATILVAALLAVTPATGAGGAESIHVARFQGDRAAAVSFTFDDNMRNQYELAVPMLERYGFCGTFFVIAGLTPDTDEEAAKKLAGDHGSISWQRLKEMAGRGHEIGNHSWSHPNLRELDGTKLDEEVNKAYRRIAEKIGTPPLTFCYPGNSWDNRVLEVVVRNHVAARDRLVPYGGKTFTTAKANAFIDEAITRGQPMVAMIHGITTGYEPFTSADVLENHLRYVKSRQDRIWVDTFANVSRYTQERDAAKLTSTQSPGAAAFTLECSLDPKRFDYPLTVVIPVKNVTDVQAKRQGVARLLPVEIRADRIVIQAAPSPQPVMVTWRTAATPARTP